MAKKKSSSPTEPGMATVPSRPSLRVEVPVASTLPDLDAKVRVTLSGKVITSSKERQRWNDNKKVAQVEVEYDHQDVKISGTNRNAEIEEMDARL